MRTRRASLCGGGLLALSLVAGACGGDEASVTPTFEAGKVMDVIRAQEGAAVGSRIDLSGLGVRMSTDRRADATVSANYRIALRAGEDPFRTFVSDQLAKGYVSGRFAWSYALMSGNFERRTQTSPFVDRYVASALISSANP